MLERNYFQKLHLSKERSSQIRRDLSAAEENGLLSNSVDKMRRPIPTNKTLKPDSRSTANQFLRKVANESRKPAFRQHNDTFTVKSKKLNSEDRNNKIQKLVSQSSSSHIAENSIDKVRWLATKSSRRASKMQYALPAPTSFAKTPLVPSSPSDLYAYEVNY